MILHSITFQVPILNFKNELNCKTKLSNVKKRPFQLTTRLDDILRQEEIRNIETFRMLHNYPAYTVSTYIVTDISLPFLCINKEHMHYMLVFVH